MNVESIVTVASIVAGFGSAIFAIRIQEADTGSIGSSRIPWADRLLILAIFASLAVLLLLLILQTEPWVLVVARSLMAFSVVMMAGYLVAALARYRFQLAEPEASGEPAPRERWIGLITVGVACLAGALTLYNGRGDL
jgi:hypothetical protein